MFSLQSRKAKAVWENVYICNFDIIDISTGRYYANFRLIFAFINMSLCYVADTLAYVYKEADVIAFDCMADVIAMFSFIEQMLSPYLVYVYQQADVIAFYDYIGRCFCHVSIYILHCQICILQW